MNYFASIDIYEDLNPKDKDTAMWEILIMLLGAYALGLLTYWLLCRIKHGRRQKSVKPVKAAAARVVTVKPDDLTVVEGIGPKINQILHKAGIQSYQDLANSDRDTIKQILDQAGPRYQMHEPATWPEQARLAAEGLFEELDALKDSLDGGR